MPDVVKWFSHLSPGDIVVLAIVVIIMWFYHKLVIVPKQKFHETCQTAKGCATERVACQNLIGEKLDRLTDRISAIGLVQESRLSDLKKSVDHIATRLERHIEKNGGD